MDHFGDMATPVPTGASPRMRGGCRPLTRPCRPMTSAGMRESATTCGRTPVVARRGCRPHPARAADTAREVWDRVADGPPDDVTKFRDELLWQEYARHLYARMGTRSTRSLRYTVEDRTAAPENPWQTSALCLESSWAELTTDGWLTNQARMWLASHWSVRMGLGWRR